MTDIDKVKLGEGILEVIGVLRGSTKEVIMWRAGVKDGVARGVREAGDRW